MSLMWSLKRFIDPAQWLREEWDRRSAREDKEGEPKADDPPPQLVMPEETVRVAERGACRTCAWESASGEFCPKCLADTMQRVTR